MKKNLIQQINFVKQIQPGCNFLNIVWKYTVYTLH